jgi:hypothetical protein
MLKRYCELLMFKIRTRNIPPSKRLLIASAALALLILSGCAGLVTQPTNNNPLSITINSLPSAQMKQAYSVALTASGGTAPLTWSISSGSLPAGLSLSSGGDITGTPTSVGNSSFTVKVSDSSSPAQSATVSLSITVTGGTLQISTSSLPNGQTGTAYSATLSASGGTSPYTWAVSAGSLPAGLSLNSAGQISGNPTTTGTSSFTLRVTDSSSPAQATTANFSITITSSVTPVQITTTSLPGGKTGTSYSTTLAATGGTAPYTWSIVSLSLPAGLSLSSSGQISGTPTTAGNSSFTVKVTDSSSPVQNATAVFGIDISSSVTPVEITTSSLPNGKTGVSYGADLAASGGTTPYSWSISSGSLPAGLTLSSSGLISGTPTTAGTSSFTVKVTDSSSPSQVTTANLSITVTASVTPVQITTSSLAGGQTGTAYSSTLSASGGTTPYSWSISSGSLPAGLTLNSSGQISGTPTTAGTSSFTVKVNDSSSPAQTATASLSITITTSVTPVVITTASLPGGKTSTAYSSTLSASGGTTPYSWSISSGSLPAGLTLSASGQISGTPTTAGTSSFTVKVTDSSSPAQTKTASLSITVTSSVTPVQITTSSLPSGKTGTSYSSTLSATGGTTPYNWSVSSGSLPAGLTLSTSGQISGTPTTAGTSSFTVKVTDSSSPAQTATASLSITITASVTPVQITTSSLTGGQTGTAYSATLSATGGTTPYSWSVSSGSLPAGLTLSTSGQISGTPTSAGTSSFTVKVTDSSSPAQTATASLSITITASVTPVQITTSSLTGGQTGTAYSATLSATGGTTPYSWSISSGSLPAGLTLSASGHISGTPTTAGTSSFTVKVTDSSSPAQTATASLSITITASITPVQITTSSLAGGQTGTAYSATLSATGGTTPYSWSVSSGSLPAGLTLSTSGHISGTPTTAGTSSFTVKVTDSSSPAQTATASLSITITASVTPVQITTSSLPDGETGSSYSTTLAASGGTTPYTWSISSGSLPAGLTLSSSGQISGTPTATGTSSFTVQVTDSSSPAQSATANLSITITSASSGSATLIICPNLGQTGNRANCVTPPTLTFGKQGTNTTSAALGVSVNNCSTSAIPACTGSGSLTLGSPYYTLSGPNASDFAVTTSGTCANGGAVASGSSCSVVVRFTPTQSAGTNESATLTISGDAQNGSQSLSLTGSSATVTQVSGCQSLNGSTNYQLISNVAASGSCFTVGQSNTDINLNGFTITYCNSSSSSFVGGVLMDGGSVQSTTVHNGTINEGSGNCSGLLGPGYGSGAVAASSDGSSTESLGTSLFNLNINVGTNIGSAKVLFEENAGNSSSLGTVVHDVIYTDNDSKSCGNVGCRDQDQGYPVVIDQSERAGATQFYNVIGTGGTQGGVVTTAANSNLHNNVLAPGSSASTLSNGFAFQDWGTNVTVGNNLVVGSGPNGSCLSCRGVQVSSVNNVPVSGSIVQNNVFYTSNLANDVEYGGCQIDGSYGMQINTAGASQDLSNNTFLNNKVYVSSSVCPGFGFSWSGATAANGPNNTKSNIFSCTLAPGYSQGPCAGIRLDANQYNPGIAAVVGTGDTYIGDTSAIYIWYDGTPTWTCKQCTFSKGSNPISNWVMLDYDGGQQVGQSSQTMYLIDPTFTNGAAKDSNNLASWASNNSGLSFSYVVEWTYTITVKGASSGNPIAGAAVTAISTQGLQACVGVTNSSGQYSCTLTDTAYAAASGHYTATSSNPFTVNVTAVGCSLLSNVRTILSTTSETVSIPGC